ncbi:Acetylornithine deacetylase/Succinyl-diaminopimelate desuccinylase [Pseudarthrobacter equi]|uniref:Acetylornithine deacetylase/Succinyl-diaminopimelate desuccinylase n=1 Tax=Pseudarthrobacter equi TaxID=728066 RepID=A0A1H2BQ95_9MICC|nr:M20 family metallopeptidase [Pseudarthrobacter equi]SDT60079.1 Acetylornithine deacetylase/Succinyl-diaminopimelate desuccinylase [Pseudarthrobacter equi]
MQERTGLLATAAEFVDSGRFREDLARLVSYPTESFSPQGRVALKSYLDDVVEPAFREMGCTVNRFDAWRGGANSFLVATRHEDPELPTVLCYGHADVTDGQAGEWSAGRSPWALSDEGDRWYGRGAADNKGQHWINIVSLRLLLEQQGRLGFNLVFLLEGAEEIGSPDLADFAAEHHDLLRADVFIGSDGPRLAAESPTVFLGARGGVSFELIADLRAGSYHSGNWGGLLRNPATTVAAAVASLVDGHGTIQLPELLPAGIPDSVAAALDVLDLLPNPGDPRTDPAWGDRTLSPAERLYAWNTLEVLALGAGNPDKPVNAIPGTARAALQLRFVPGTDVDNLEAAIRKHLDSAGFGMVELKMGTSFAASRIDPDNPWVAWAANSLAASTGREATVLPNIGGSLPSYVFADALGLPTLWIPHSHPGCQQHAPDEHLLVEVAREGLQIASGLFFDLANSHSPASTGADQPSLTVSSVS